MPLQRPLPLFCPPIANDALFSPWHPSPAAVPSAVPAAHPVPPAADPGAPHRQNAKLSPNQLATSYVETWARCGPLRGRCRVRARGFTHFSRPRSPGPDRTLGEISLEKVDILSVHFVNVLSVGHGGGGGAAASHNTTLISFSLQCRYSGGRRVCARALPYKILYECILRNIFLAVAM